MVADQSEQAGYGFRELHIGSPRGRVCSQVHVLSFGLEAGLIKGMAQAVPFFRMRQALCGLLLLSAARLAGAAGSPIRFEMKPIPFNLETGEVIARHVPATMAGGVAIFDFNKDGRPDIYFTNGANLQSLKKDSALYNNRLFRNDGNGVFTDVTAKAGLTGSGFDCGAAVADYDNDG